MSTILMQWCGGLVGEATGIQAELIDEPLCRSLQY